MTLYWMVFGGTLGYMSLVTTLRYTWFEESRRKGRGACQPDAKESWVLSVFYAIVIGVVFSGLGSLVYGLYETENLLPALGVILAVILGCFGPALYVYMQNRAVTE